MGTVRPYEVRALRNRVASNHCSADASDELLPRDDLLAHQVAAALGLYLILNVARSETSADVLGDSATDHGRSTETIVQRLAQVDW